jgi:hypothetical protein
MDDGTDGWKASRKRTTTSSPNWHPNCLARRLCSVRTYTCVCYSKNGDKVDCPSGFKGGFIVGTIFPFLYVMLYTTLLPRAHKIEQIWHLGMKTVVSFLVHCSSFFVWVLPSSFTLYFSIGMCDILWSKLKYCMQSMQDAITHHGF